MAPQTIPLRLRGMGMMERVSLTIEQRMVSHQDGCEALPKWFIVVGGSMRANQNMFEIVYSALGT